MQHRHSSRNGRQPGRPCGLTECRARWASQTGGTEILSLRGKCIMHRKMRCSGRQAVSPRRHGPCIRQGSTFYAVARTPDPGMVDDVVPITRPVPAARHAAALRADRCVTHRARTTPLRTGLLTSGADRLHVQEHPKHHHSGGLPSQGSALSAGLLPCRCIRDRHFQAACRRACVRAAAASPSSAAAGDSKTTGEADCCSGLR